MTRRIIHAPYIYKKFTPIFILSFAGLLLSSCGSGGGDSSTPQLINDPPATSYSIQGCGGFSDLQTASDDALPLAIDGRGYLILSDAGSISYTRGANFLIDDYGFFLQENSGDENGPRLQGYGLDINGNITIGVIGDIRVADIDPALISIEADGLVISMDGTDQTIHGQLAIANFNSPYQLLEFKPGQLAETGSFEYSQNLTLTSGSPIIGAPLTGSLGTIKTDGTNASVTDYCLNLAANDHYLVFDNNGARSYAQSTQLFSDKDGYFIDEFGNQLISYGIDTNGEIALETTKALRLQIQNIAPKPSSLITLNGELNNLDNSISNTFDHLDSASYNIDSSITIYDSMGQAHELSLYFVKTATVNHWQLYYWFNASGAYAEETQVGGPYPMIFDSFGDLSSSATIDTELLSPGTGASHAIMTLNVSNLSQRDQANSLNLSQNGYPPGRAEGLAVDTCGEITVSYTNGIDTTHGQVALASFANPDGLVQNDKGLFEASETSGEAILEAPCIDAGDSLVGDTVD